MFFLLYTISAAGMYIFTLIIFDKLYTSRELSLLKKILIIGAISISKGALNMIDIPIVKFITAFVLLILVNLVFYKPPGKVFLIYDAIYMITSSIVEMLSTLMLAFMLNVTTEDIKFSPVLFLAATILSWIVMIAVAKCFLLIVAGKGMNNIRTHEFLMFLVLMIGEILLFQYLNDKISSSNSRWEIVVILLTFLSLDLYLAYLIRMISRAYQTEKELELVTQQSMLQLNAYKELNEKYAASRRVIHDVRKHISSLEGLINSNKADEAERYKDLLNAELNKLMPRFALF